MACKLCAAERLQTATMRGVRESISKNASWHAAVAHAAAGWLAMVSISTLIIRPFLCAGSARRLIVTSFVRFGGCGLLLACWWLVGVVAVVDG